MEVVEWTSVAVTSGVVGNTAYDALQRVRQRALGRRKLLRYPRLARDDALLVGRIAIEAFANQKGLKIDPEKLDIKESEQARSRTWYLIFHYPGEGSATTNFHVRVYGNPRKVEVAAE